MFHVYICVCVSVSVCVHLTHPVQSGCDTKLISLVGCRWFKFSFSSTGCLNNAKESSLTDNSFISGRWRDGFMPFPISAKRNVNSIVQDLNSGHRFYLQWRKRLRVKFSGTEIQTDQPIPTRRQDLVLISKKKKIIHLVDFLIPVDHRVKKRR